LNPKPQNFSVANPGNSLPEQSQNAPFSKQATRPGIRQFSDVAKARNGQIDARLQFRQQAKSSRFQNRQQLPFPG
jgi:hypothetical protein